MPIVLDGSLGLTTPTYGGADTSEYLVPVTGFKNRIINGNMMIDQRNAGASVTQTTSTIYTLDRWNCYGTVASKFTVQQSSVAPTGFRNSALITSSSAYSIVSGDIFQFVQPIEGFNTADLMWGTANAQTVTLSFWVRSSLTGTFGGSLSNNDGSRSYVFSYSISSANTWEQKTITIAGDTTGTWNTTNGTGISVRYQLGTGSTYSNTAGSWYVGNVFSATGATSVVGTNGATFYITGVQLEVGSTATSFDYRPYGTELQLCQRYFQIMGGLYGQNSNTTQVGFACAIPVTMRAVPTVSAINPLTVWNSQVGLSTQSSVNINTSGAGGINWLNLFAQNFTGLTAQNQAVLYDTPIRLTAEL